MYGVFGNLLQLVYIWNNICYLFTDGRQFTVYNKEQILQESEKARYIDCRLNAYPIFSESESELVSPTIIFIDIDGDSKKLMNSILKRTLKKIRSKLKAYLPTVLWTGNGYHLYVVLDTTALELMPKLTELCSEPSKLFHKFAESYLTNGMNDLNHNPTFKSCLLRIPGTLNSKCLSHNVDAEVKIIRRFQEAVPLIDRILSQDITSSKG